MALAAPGRNSQFQSGLPAKRGNIKRESLLSSAAAAFVPGVAAAIATAFVVILAGAGGFGTRLTALAAGFATLVARLGAALHPGLRA